ncbi:alpha/beta hydrolase fold domain-containing protein [Patulibacter sp.]|uniref:alpha/beta hydrolase fold domain-containing protein n=1 Tax=Patulibacter sp. TaxID=1912859 RepID=UPI002726C1A1|nr:alpha/beta hydrolase fold domain-containing protein [Patulibacter sp.]MDO9407974.1 alpha/beta hydrolase fold domain-containing protein [Patulibacter sp.]
MPSPSTRLIAAVFRATGRNRTFISADAARAHVRERAVRPVAFAPPARLRRDVAVHVTRDAGRPVYVLRPRGSAPAGGLVYAHGGGWVNEIASQHWHLAAQIAAEAGVAVTVPIYPLVPFGTAAEVVPWVADLVARDEATYGRSLVGGDSAGGQIALSAAMLLRDRDGIRPALTLLISPALDLTFSNPEIEVVQPTDPWLGVPGGRVLAEHWRGGLPLEDPLVSPLLGDLAGLGPLSVHTGTRDVMNPDARLLVAAARALGVDVASHEEQGLLHVYPLLPTPEGRASRRVLVDEVRAAVGA